MYQIKFGTDGWREIIADNFTTANVRRVAYATALWLKEKNPSPACVVGYDCRFGGEMFARETASILAENGVTVYLSTGFVSTPMVSLGANKYNAEAGVIITASHNPPSYNGYKLKAGYGGPAIPSEVERVEQQIPFADVAPADFEMHLSSGRIEFRDLETLYLNHLQQCFDMNALTRASKSMVYDAMYGAGQGIVKKALPDATCLHASNNPGFEGRAPEPILKNLPEIAAMIAGNDNFLCGLATDGDADRIGFFDENGRFVDSHNLILLLLEYLTTYKGLSGKVVKSFSVSDKVKVLCDLKGIESITTKIGFKYICEYMVNDDVLIGAEESGGIAIKGHIPERDGVWMGLVILEYMAVSGKTVSQLLADIYAKTGTFAVERYDLHLDEAKKQAIVAACKGKQYSSFGDLSVQSAEDMDGFKFRFGEGRWVMIRPSGTEPVLRVYAEAESSEAAYHILDTVKATILA